MKKPLVTSPAVVMAPRADGFEVVWGVSRLSRGRLEWATGEEAGVAYSDAFGMVPQSDRVLRVRLNGMPAGAEVRVRAVTEAVTGRGVKGAAERHESEWKTVRTLDPAAGSAHFAVWNDTHRHKKTLRALHAATPEVDMLIWNGDLCNDWKHPSTFVDTVLDPAGCDVSRGRPLTISLGNHDVRGTWAYQLQEYVATPEGRPYTAFRVGPVAGIVLHTGEDKPDGHPSFKGRVAFEALRAEQAQWLREATARPEIRDAPYRVVFCHIPLRWVDEHEVDYEHGGYDSFSKMSRDEWHDALSAWGAQIVVSGHMHETASIPPSDEFGYAQLVSGGPEASARSKEAATWVEGVANAGELVLTMRDLSGAVLHEVRLEPLA
ncbi:metallophosphoesterase family protein [Microterricola viridarii]|uniref:Calcineurin-like phosphoesterase n=1 Tax=Microterricola viridarii TaxID=412690 RepID=A0A1H1LQJ4_9MICO|nr:metallophosphoesterase [Microterricola viridarii]SDR76874.1 Calcineurin-like phosphoesterase [Microterricola viridarii]